MPTDADVLHLRRCIELATEALEAGDEPFGSVLVAVDGTVLVEDLNRVAPANGLAIQSSSWPAGPRRT